MNGADQHGGKKRGNRSSVRTCFRQDFFHRYGYLQDLHIVMGQFFSFQAYCGRILFLFSLSLGRIILRKAVFFPISRSDLFFFRDPGDPFIRMSQDKIILHKLQKKIHGARSVGQRVEHFEIDPVFIVCNFKQQRFFVRDIQPAAGRFFLFRRQWPDISPLQIEPEQTLPENRLKQRVFLHCLIQGRLKDLRLYRFFQFTVKPENPCIVLPALKRKGQSRIIQFSPFRISFFHFTQHPSLLCQHCFYTLLFSRNPFMYPKLSLTWRNCIPRAKYPWRASGIRWISTWFPASLSRLPYSSPSSRSGSNSAVSIRVRGIPPSFFSMRGAKRGFKRSPSPLL